MHEFRLSKSLGPTYLEENSLGWQTVQDWRSSSQEMTSQLIWYRDGECNSSGMISWLNKDLEECYLNPTCCHAKIWQHKNGERKHTQMFWNKPNNNTNWNRLRWFPYLMWNPKFTNGRRKDGNPRQSKRRRKSKMSRLPTIQEQPYLSMLEEVCSWAREVWVIGTRMNVIEEALRDLGIDLIQEVDI